MGYNTEFSGVFTLDRVIDDDLYNELEALDGPFDEKDAPSMWNQWRVGNDGQSIEWNGGEKFYGYIGWIRYINDKYLRPANYIIDGTVAFQGEDLKDGGKIVAKSGDIRVYWNHDDPKRSNFDAKSKRLCNIPEGQSVSWINRKRTIFVDVGNICAMAKEDVIAEQMKLNGITIGNPAAIALFIDTSAKSGTSREWRVGKTQSKSSRVRIVSLDMAMPLVDEERGACARLQSLCDAAKNAQGIL